MVISGVIVRIKSVAKVSKMIVLFLSFSIDIYYYYYFLYTCKKKLKIYIDDIIILFPFLYFLKGGLYI